MKDFCGIIKVDDDEYACFVSGNIARIIPEGSNARERNDIFARIEKREPKESEYLYGISNYSKFALLHRGKFKTESTFSLESLYFYTPVVITALGNASGFYDVMTEAWERFHSIEFHGGNLNALYNPYIAIDYRKEEKKSQSDEVWNIKLHPWTKYYKEKVFWLGNEKVRMTISISHSPEKQNRDNHESYELGKLDSYIRLSFSKSKSFEDIEKYFLLVRKLVAFLTAQNNVFFENIYISQRVENNKYYRIAKCDIKDSFENYSNKNQFKVISINSVWNHLPKLMNWIYEGKTTSIFDVLPVDNNMVGKISINNVQDLCTSLEVIYLLKKREKRKKDIKIEELKNSITKTIKEFEKENPEINVEEHTTKSSAFQYLDFTARTKILTLYKENKQIVDEIIRKRSLPPISDESVKKFLRLRNLKTHSGRIEWGDGAEIYLSLLVLVYVVILKNAGMTRAEIKEALVGVF